MRNRLLLLLVLPLVANNCLGSSMTASVIFGTKTTTGIYCQGKGISKATTAETQSPGAIKVNFDANPDNDTLILTFSLCELAYNQLNQVTYFTNPSKTYSFDNTFLLTDPFFAALNLKPNAKILPTSPTYFKITGDVITLSIKYAHNSFIASTVVFGSKPFPAGGYAGRGIFKATGKNASGIPEGIPVSIHSNPDHDTLLLLFSLSDLVHKQIAQVANFADTTRNYPFDNLFALNDPLFAALNLQPNAKIMPTSPTRVRIAGDTVKLYIKYTHNSSLVASVTFGDNALAGGIGKGLTNVIPNDAPPPPNAVRVSFQANPDNDSLTMMFSLFEMMNRQLYQLSYFANPSGTYSFDDEYPLTNAIYGALNLPPNSKISRKSPTTLSISGDQVKLTVAYAHD